MKIISSLLMAGALALSATAGAEYQFEVPTGGNFCAGNYSFQFAVSNKQAVSTSEESPTVLAAYWGERCFAPDAGLYTICNKDGEFVLKVGRGTLRDFNAPERGCTYTNSATFHTPLSTDTVYTITVKGKEQNAGGQKVTLSENGTRLEVATYSGNLNGGNERSHITTWFNQDFDAAKASSLRANFVPYAAGAAGLLALAWLLLRRRSKSE